MITFSKFSDSVIEAGKRVLKIMQFGVKTADESSPFGFDSSPIDGMIAIHCETSNNSESVIIGYINESQLAQKGEVRLFSLDENKNLKTFLWLKNNGTLELNGNNYTSVRFSPLQTSIQSTDTDLNAEFSKIATAISGLGGVYTPSLINTDISSSESNTVKLK